MESSESPSFQIGGFGGASPTAVFLDAQEIANALAKQEQKEGKTSQILSLTSHTGHMKKRKLPWFRIALLVVELCVLVAAVAFPLVIADTTVDSFLRILELLARLS